MQISGHEENETIFKNNAHKAFYNHQTALARSSAGKEADCYTKSLIYTLGICDDTRRRFESIYDAKGRRIVTDAILAAWQTSGSLKVTRLAFQLFTDGTPSAFIDYDKPDVDECRRYSVSDIFCCEFAPYFVEAIKIRYPEYMIDRKGLL